MVTTIFHKLVLSLHDPYAIWKYQMSELIVATIQKKKKLTLEQQANL
jgi:hypothetical protein